MKKLLSLIMVFAFAFAVNAQVETPQPSPKAKLEQKVGLTDFTVEYSRPGVKGRTIFGGLEPWGTIWRTGANENTKFTVSDDFTFGGTAVKAGTYAIYTRLNSATDWDVMLYADSNNWGTPRNWDDSKVVATVKAKVEQVPFTVETMMIDFNGITNEGANLEILWERSYVMIPLTVPTDQKVTASIDKVMNGPSAEDYYAAAVYNLSAEKDMEKAVMWIDKAIELTNDKPRFWYIHQQALIHAKAGDRQGAIKAAKRSLSLAKEAKYDAYIKKNEAVLKEWGAM